MQQTTADGCSLADGSLNMGETISLQAIVEIELDNLTSQFASCRKIVFLEMSWKPKDMVKLGNEKNKKFDHGG